MIEQMVRGHPKSTWAVNNAAKIDRLKRADDVIRLQRLGRELVTDGVHWLYLEGHHVLAWAVLDKYELELDGKVQRRLWRLWRLTRWRRAARLVGKLQMWNRRAAERAYSPDGGGLLVVRDEFEQLAASTVPSTSGAPSEQARTPPTALKTGPTARALAKRLAPALMPGFAPTGKKPKTAPVPPVAPAQGPEPPKAGGKQKLQPCEE